MKSGQKKYFGKTTDWWIVVTFYLAWFLFPQHQVVGGDSGSPDGLPNWTLAVFAEYWRTNIFLFILIVWKVFEHRFYNYTGVPKKDVHLRNFLPMFFEMYLIFVVFLTFSEPSTLTILWRSIFNPLYWFVVILFVIVHIAARLGIGIKE